ncbi:MAG: hypothetical protein AAF135_07745, partial [Bacteroidota bacterium]
MPNDTFEVARNKIKLKLLKQFDEGENYKKQNFKGEDHIFWDEVKRNIEKKNVSAEEKVKEIKRYLENRDYLLHLEEAKSAILDAFREWRDQIERRPTVSEYRQLITVFNGIWQLTVDDRGAREYRKVKELFHIQLEQENKKKGNQFFQILILSVIISTVNWLISSWACIFVDSYQVLVSVISHFLTVAIWFVVLLLLKSPLNEETKHFSDPYLYRGHYLYLLGLVLMYVALAYSFFYPFFQGKALSLTYYFSVALLTSIYVLM